MDFSLESGEGDAEGSSTLKEERKVNFCVALIIVIEFA
jgi:hypothetical protein